MTKTKPAAIANDDHSLMNSGHTFDTKIIVTVCYGNKSGLITSVFGVNMTIGKITHYFIFHYVELFCC